MSAPNIASLTTITGKTAYALPANTSAAVLLANAASSGKVYKVNQVVVSNLSATTAASTSVAYNTASDGSGTSYTIASTISVPANASLIVIDKSTQIYLEENRSLVITSGTASGLSYTVSYEEMS